MEVVAASPERTKTNKEVTQMQDPSTRLSDIIKLCTKSADHHASKLVGEKGEAALVASHDVLKRLKDDGCDLIGSVESSSAVRTGRRLDQRQTTETECTALSEVCSTHVNEVDILLQSTWTEAFKNTAPHQLTSDIKEIQGMSDDILNTQQVLIDRLRDEVNQADKIIQLEIERQTEDLGVMRKRMKDHLDFTRTTQRCQLGEIDAAFGKDYDLLLEDHNNLIDQMLADWSTSENEIVGELNDIGSQWVDDLDQTDAYYYNECCRTRNRLTADIQLIEQELEKLKVDFTLNNEVLDYNCRVLKLREEERAGLIVRNKRKINRLTDRYRQLKEENDKIEINRQGEEIKLIKEVEHLRTDCDVMERKFSTIKSSNDRQLESICEMAEDRISELLKKLANIDERIFVEILEQPWDKLVGVSSHIKPKSAEIDLKDLDKEIERLEKNLKFLTDAVVCADNPKERLMKALDIPDEHEFRVMLSSIRSVPDSELMKELACYVHLQRSRPADQPVTSRRYLTDAAAIRSHFELFKETAVPKKRLDMWKMLARALIQYERILRDRLTLAADLLTLTKQPTALG
uniref:Dynein regulatory complex protein 1/2 N-terminal domain-containing protein n=1 Tax=Daphnia galeata TaxID=27404 RepID=A0A8J2W989_9CRUS|nr:unnamed protein product [Daphnia galeata]